MTRFRKLLLTLLCFALALSTLLVVTSCDAQQGFELTLNYNSEGGTVTASKPLYGGKLYGEKELVTVTVSPASNYEVVVFEVSNQPDAALNEQGVYSFVITQDTTVTVSFGENSTHVDGANLTVTATITPAEGGEVTVSPSRADNKYKKGEFVSVTVELAPHYQFVSATKNGQPLSLNTQLKTTFRVEEDAEILVTVRKVFAVELNYDPDGATVELSPKQADNLYDPNTQVTLFVQVKENFELVSVAVDGEDVTSQATSADGYAFVVTDDVTVDVVTDRPLSQQMLESVRGSIRFSGEIVSTNLDTDEQDFASLSTLFDFDAKVVRHTEGFEEETIADNIYCGDADDKVVRLSRMPDGTVSRQKPTDDYGMEQSVPFADYFNPFERLSVNDFTYVGNSVWQLDLDKANAAAFALTNYHDDIISFRIRVENDQVVSVEIQTDEMTVLQDIIVGVIEMRVQRSYTLTVSDRGTATIPSEMYSDYSLTEEHAALQQAIDSAKAATSYKATVTIAESTSTFYYADDVLWEDLGDGEGLGYYMRSDGNLWVFAREEGVLANVEPLDGYTLQDVLAYFLPQNASLSVFENAGDGVWKLRDFDATQTYNFSYTFGGIFADAFALGQSFQDYFSGAQNLSLTLKNGALYKVEFDFMSAQLTHAEMVFEGYNATALPQEIDVSQIEQGKFDVSYVGTWLDVETSEKLEINLEAVTVNDVVATFVGGNATDGYTVKAENVTYTLLLDGEHLVVTYGGNQHTYRKQICAWEMFFGQYSALNNNGELCTLEVNADGLTLTLAGRAHEVRYMEFLYSDRYEVYYFNFLLDDDLATSYFVMQVGEGYDLLNFFDDGNKLDLLFRTESYTPDLSEFAGSYQDETGNYTVNVSEHDITLSVKDDNGNVQNYPATNVDIAVLFNDTGVTLRKYVQISFWANNTKYFMQSPETFKLGWLFLWNVDESVNTEVIDRDFSMSWEMYTGTFTGTYANVVYTVTIEQDSITVAIGTETYTAENVFFNFDYREQIYYFLLTVNGTDYTLKQDDASFNRLRLYNNAMSVTVSREGMTFDLSDYVGTYEGTDDVGTKYVVVVTEHAITVTIGNGAPIEAEIVDFDRTNKDDEIVYMKLNGKNYKFRNYFATLYLQDEQDNFIMLEAV